MLGYFGKTLGYLNSIDLGSADPLDRKAHDLINDEMRMSGRPRH
jgi:hypothetical protein